jgi:uncharacterized protein
MELKSSIYESAVYHKRLEPIIHEFGYKIYTFALDLDELETLSKSVFFFGLEKFNLFSFYREDHLNFGKPTQKENILHYLKTMGMEDGISKIVLVTNLRVLGYVFNPVCFYYCYDLDSNLVCVIVEVHNTFGEMKPFLLTSADLNAENTFVKRYTKFFYVSPFEDLQTEFEFRIQNLGEKLNIDIDDFKENRCVFLAGYRGTQKEFTNTKALYYFFRYPLVTLHIIAQIHWQALKLVFRKLPFLRKNQNLDQQRGVYLGKDYT